MLFMTTWRKVDGRLGHTAQYPFWRAIATEFLPSNVDLITSESEKMNFIQDYMFILSIVFSIPALSYSILVLSGRFDNFINKHRYVLILSSTLPMIVFLLIVFTSTYRSVVSGQKETRNAIKAIQSTVAGVASQLGAENEAAAARAKSLLKPYRRRYIYIDSETVEAEHSQHGEPVRLVSYQVELAEAFQTQSGVDFSAYLQSEAFEEDRQRISNAGKDGHMEV